MVYMTLLAMHARKPISFPAVRRVTNTAAALPADILPKLREIFPEALIFSMYGLTECKRACYLEPEWLPEKPGSVGKAIPGTEVLPAWGGWKSGGVPRRGGHPCTCAARTSCGDTGISRS